jgi:D-glycero-D-manno-heptose 1,7-bisphosphate phosphatase
LTAPATPLVLLDRDGVINRDSVEYIKSAAEWAPLPGSLEAIARLSAAGFGIAVVTNQSGIGRGLFSEAALAEIHAVMRAAVEAAGGRIDAVYHCPHRPDFGCDCRKPGAALVRRAVAELGRDASRVTLIGDKLSDVGAAVAAGVRPMLVGSRVGDDEARDVPRFADLAAAVDALLDETGTGTAQ